MGVHWAQLLSRSSSRSRQRCPHLPTWRGAVRVSFAGVTSLMKNRRSLPTLRLGVALTGWLVLSHSGIGQLPNPVLNTVIPAGGSAGSSLEITVNGSGLEGLRGLRCTAPNVQFESLGESKFRVTIPAETAPGLYDLRAVGKHGLSSARVFQISHRNEQHEVEPNDALPQASSVATGSVVNGVIAAGGDQDHFQFSATKGQRIVLECWAQRIDSTLHPVLELFAANGKQLAASRAYVGIDAMIDFHVPSDGNYVVRIHDVVFSGSANHFYRIDIDRGPRVAVAVPAVIEAGKAARVRLLGWNLENATAATTDGPPPTGAGGGAALDQLVVEIPAAQAQSQWPLPLGFTAAQTGVEGFAYQLPGAHAPVFIGISDVPVIASGRDNRAADRSQSIEYPCELTGQLSQGDERHWYRFTARRGEVLYLEGLGQRIGAPVDLAISVLDAENQNVLFQCHDESRNVGGKTLPTSHHDPSGRWVVPADGQFLLVVRNLTGGASVDPRRVYRVSLRREEPRLDLAVIPHNGGPAGLNVPRGGRSMLDVVAFRRRGLTGSIRIAARDLPTGVSCPDVWLGPGIERGQVVVSADETAEPYIGSLQLEGFESAGPPRPARGGVIVRGGTPNGWSRLTAELPLAVVGEAPLRITANGHESRKHHLYGELTVRHSPGGILDVAVHVERRDPSHRADVKLIGVGVPGQIPNQTVTIPANRDKGYLSFYLPPTLPVGRYTLGIQAQTTIPTGEDKKTSSITVHSDAVNFEVHPPAFQVALDPYAPNSIKRGQVIQVNYTVRRINGFINKIHTELATARDVTSVGGLLCRGVTFVGQTESGVLQIVANSDAPLGPISFLRCYAVGVVEDEAIYHGSCFLPLKVVE